MPLLRGDVPANLEKGAKKMPYNEILIKNSVFEASQSEKPVFNPAYEAMQGSLLERLHNCKRSIQEKAFGNISAFNFNRDVFNNGKWDDLTVKARGLFLNNQTGEIVARGFEKFFGYKERQFNSDEFLQDHLAYPVTAYVKYNGFLGILGYDENGLLFCSKSTVGGDYAEIFKRIFKKQDHREQELLNYMRDCNVGFVFEVIDPVNDPHIVEYDKEDLILLDCIKLNEKFRDVGYPGLCALAKEFNFHVKERAFSFEDWDSLHTFLAKEESNATTKQEGYVLVDANNYQFKLKSAWYKFWKMLRAFKDKIASGRQFSISGISNPDAIKFIGWAKDKGMGFCRGKSIIELRNQFNQED